MGLSDLIPQHSKLSMFGCGGVLLEVCKRQTSTLNDTNNTQGKVPQELSLRRYMFRCVSFLCHLRRYLYDVVFRFIIYVTCVTYVTYVICVVVWFTSLFVTNMFANTPQHRHNPPNTPPHRHKPKHI